MNRQSNKLNYYQGETLKEAISVMKQELGDDCILIDHKVRKKGGFLGFFGQEFYEVCGMSADVARPEKKKARRPDDAPLLNFDFAGKITDKDINASITREVGQKPGGLSSITYNALPKKPQAPAPETGYSVIKNEIDDMKLKIDVLYNKILQNSEGIKRKVYPGRLDEMFKKMVDNDIHESISMEILDRLMARTSLYENYDLLKDFLIGEMSARVKVNDIFKQKVKGKKPEIFVFLGPTGVGKTTTLAKLCSEFAIRKSRKIALFTIDTYRIAAAEQLKLYADIIDIPIVIVSGKEEFREALDKHSDCDLIFMDTAGRSQYDIEKLEELKNIVGDAQYKKILLMSASTKLDDMLDIVGNFKKISIDSIIFTKVDETKKFGTMFNLLYKNEIPISYITMGQKVPEDIRLVEPESIAKMMWTNSLE